MNKISVLKHVLEDFLELKASLSTQTARPIKRFLFSQSLKRLEVSGVEGFRLDKNLVLLENGTADPVENIVFLKPGIGSIRVRQIGK